jgi:large subunit ribosomal protein L18
VSKTSRSKRKARLRRHRRVRRKVFGTAEKPRMSVFRSLNHIYAQIIDDVSGRTLVSATSLKAELPVAGGASKDNGSGGKRGKPESVKMRRSRAVGKLIAEAALEKGIKQVVFDKGGYLYHGRVAALAEAARKSGMEF